VLSVLPAVVWLRPEPATSPAALLTLARDLNVRARDAGGLLLVGDRVDVAIAAGAGGVHLGTRSAPVGEVRRLLAATGSDAMVLSVAVHDEAAVARAARDADALVLSPLAAVPGKGPALGIGRFAAAVARAPAKPFVALGGIVDPAHAADAARAGASAIAVRRALLDAPDPAASCRALRDAFVAARA
jgi:thiamine-phosphate pyrophosphorylase